MQVANKHMKRDAIFVVIGNTYLTTISNTTYLLKFRNLTTPTIGKELEVLELSYTMDANVKWYNQFGELFENLLESYA